MPLDRHAQRLIELALDEDLGPGDVTSALLPPLLPGRAQFTARERMTVAGTEAAEHVFARVDGDVRVRFLQGDGAKVDPGARIGVVEGPARSILTAERLALNLLQRLSGIATHAAEAQARVGAHRAKIVDTRKTTPGLRSLEKAAVVAGGARNHRMGLFDGVMIKDNHIAALGGVKAAIEAARSRHHHLLKVECECDTLDQVEAAVLAGADVILLDNMSASQMREAVDLVSGRALLEASGGVTLERIPEIAATGVDFISMGSLTHGSRAVDIGLDWDDAA